MVTCQDCGQEMRRGRSCTFGDIELGGTPYVRTLYGAPGELGTPGGVPCHDCGVLEGGFHHFGCDWERCPRCRGQLISCGCADEALLLSNHDLLSPSWN